MNRIITIIIAILFISSLSIAQDTLYLYKSGIIVSKRAIADIDSAIFYRPSTTPKDSTLPQDSAVVDIDENIYGVVVIGTQTWMKENLKTTKYNDGTSIILVTNSSEWSTLTTPAYCNYNNTINFDSINIYGRLYNWFAVNTNQLCPLGWHVPSETDWTILTTYLGNSSIAGGKLKEIGTTHWLNPNTGATNESGFSAIPSGFRSMIDGIFLDIGSAAYYWSNTSYGNSGLVYYLFSNNTNLSNGSNHKQNAIAIRCIKD